MLCFEKWRIVCSKILVCRRSLCKKMRKSEKRKEEIEKAALILFAKKGFHDITVDDITSELGVSHGCFYRYYNNISDLFFAIIQGFFSNLEEELNNYLRNGISHKTCIHMLCERFSKEIPDSSTSLVAAMLEYAMHHEDDLTENAFNNACRVWTSFIQGGIDAGEFKNVDAKAYAQTLIFTYLGARMCSHILKIDECSASGVMKLLEDILIVK